MAAGTRWADASISETTELIGFVTAVHLLGIHKIVLKKRNYPMRTASKNSLTLEVKWEQG